MSKPKILYILSSYNIYGGTPKKTLDLLEYFGSDASLYIYHNTFPEFKVKFESTGANIFEGFYERNLFKHLRDLLKIIDDNNIDIVQTQFSFGETLGFILKVLRPNVKLLVAFVGPFKPSKLKAFFSSILYRNADTFVYVSEYVKKEKAKQFSILKKKNGCIIYNGTKRRKGSSNRRSLMEKNTLLAISGLVDWKNISVLVESLNILINERKREDLYLSVAGDGPEKENLEKLIKQYNLIEFIDLLGYQSNIGSLLEASDLFVHPSYAEGFGIAVAEAMRAGKPIIASNAGALPELIEHKKTGLIVDPNDPKQWADAIEYMITNPNHANDMAKNAKIDAEERFSVKTYTKSYEELYRSILE